MNNERRKALKKAIDDLNEAKTKIESAMEIIDNCRDEEQEAYDNLPEGIQDGEKGDAMLENISSLEDAYSYIEDVPGNIEDTIYSISERL